MASSEILGQLWSVIESRLRERPADSYVTSLFDGGSGAVAAKLREESGELIEAAEQLAAAAPEAAAEARAHVAHEAADLLFHTWVLLALAEVEPERVYAELERRFGTSGLAEKASRGGGAAC